MLLEEKSSSACAEKVGGGDSLFLRIGHKLENPPKATYEVGIIRLCNFTCYFTCDFQMRESFPNGFSDLMKTFLYCRSSSVVAINSLPP